MKFLNPLLFLAKYKYIETKQLKSQHILKLRESDFKWDKRITKRYMDNSTDCKNCLLWKDNEITSFINTTKILMLSNPLRSSLAICNQLRISLKSWEMLSDDRRRSLRSLNIYKVGLIYQMPRILISIMSFFKTQESVWSCN